MPLADLIQERIAGFYHGTSGNINVDPFHAEHILAAEFLARVGLTFEYEAAGAIVRDYGWREGIRLYVGQNPPGILITVGSDNRFSH